MNKTVRTILIIVAIIILLVLLFVGLKACDKMEGKATETSTTKVDPCAEDLAAMILRADNLQIALNKCLGIPEPMTLEQLQKEVEALRKAAKQRPVNSGSGPVYKTRTTTTANAPEDVPEMKFTTNQFSVTPGSYKKTTDAAVDINGGSKVTYTGNEPAGQIGITVTSDRFRLYYIKDSYLRENGMSIPAPKLNGVDGPEFMYDGVKGYWYYLDNTTLLSPSMVNNWEYTSIWCVYIGRIGTWDAFLPHESMKALMKKVRGREDGEVTMDELYRMNAVNSEIWTDQNKTGSIMPKSFNPINGEREKGLKKGPEDGLIYQGWDFRTRTTGTVTTEKVNGSVQGTSSNGTSSIDLPNSSYDYLNSNFYFTNSSYNNSNAGNSSPPS